MLELPPLALYVHLPWCIRKCPYCDFNSHEIAGELPQQAYIDALCADLESELRRGGGRPLHSIFFGGGTPGLFEAGSYQHLLDFVKDKFELSENIEISLEANPGATEARRFYEYRELGINRLSLGIQSFDDLRLQTLGRIHDSKQAREAIGIARQAGFENFNLDLMHGLPGQTVAAAVDDLQTAISYEPTHVSWYQLTIEPNTVFYRNPPVLPADDILEDIVREGDALLTDNGFRQYEVSAYSQPGYVSGHNHNYWSFGDYIGIGAGAHGKLTCPKQNSIIRTRKVKQPARYLRANGSWDAEVVEVTADQRVSEYLMNALRLRKGFTRSQFETRTGLPFDTIAKRVEYLLARGLLADDGSLIAATGRGYELLNSVLQEFV